MVEKINSFYISGTKNIRPDLFNEFAEKIANSLAKISPNPKKTDQPYRNGVTSTQLRKLFDEVKRYERLIINDEIKNWEAQYPYIKMIKSKVHYATARAKKDKKNDAIYYDNLCDFISEGIELIKSAQDYHVFVSLFEAVYGFYYEKRPDVRN